MKLTKRQNLKPVIIFFTLTLMLIGFSCKTDETVKRESKAQLKDFKVLETLKTDQIKPLGVAKLDNKLYFIDEDAASLRTIDLDKKGISDVIRIEAQQPRGIATDGKSIWIVDNKSKQVQNIDPATLKVTKSFDVAIAKDKEHVSLAAVAYSNNFLWIATSAGWDSKIIKMSAETGEMIFWIYAECDPRGLAINNDILYILGYNQGGLSGRISKMTVSDDSKKMRLTNKIINKTKGTEPSGITYDGKDLWITDKELKTIEKIQLQ